MSLIVLFSGYIGTIRDFSPSYGEDAKKFWDDTVDSLLAIDQQLENKAQESPDVWERIVPIIRPGFAWMQLPFGASEDLSETTVTAKLYDCYLEISMSKLHDFIDGEGYVRMAHENSNEPHPLLEEYDSATSVIEKTEAAVHDLERTFETDFPGQFKVIGAIEEISDDIGRVKIQCSTRARYILKMCWVVQSVQELHRPWYKFW